MKQALINLAIVVACIFTYDKLLKVDDVGQQLAVVNYDAVIQAVGEGKDPQYYTEVNDRLRADAVKLAAAGMVVVDSRVLVSYPPELEVPVRQADKQRVAEETEQGNGQE